MDIDPRYLDLDLSAEAASHNFGVGNAGRGEGTFAGKFGDTMSIIPRSKWQEECEKLEGNSLDLLVSRLYDQKQEGACVSNAAGQAHEIMQAVQYGKSQVVHLSAISLYKRCGRSPGSGSMLSDNLREMRTVGVLPLDNPENRKLFGEHVMPNTGFYSQYPDGWQETAKLFRGDEWWEIDSVDELISAQLLGYPVVVGRSGHSIVYVRPFYKNGRLYNLYCNSWGEGWGQAGGTFKSGFGVDSESYIRNSAYWAFALRSVVVPQFSIGEDQ